MTNIFKTISAKIKNIFRCNKSKGRFAYMQYQMSEKDYEELVAAIDHGCASFIQDMNARFEEQDVMIEKRNKIFEQWDEAMKSELEAFRQDMDRGFRGLEAKLAKQNSLIERELMNVVEKMHVNEMSRIQRIENSVVEYEVMAAELHETAMICEQWRTSRYFDKV